MNKKIGFISLGCAKNLTDTETMLGILSERGYEITSDEQSADVLVVNTCAFINSAKEESIGAILDAAKQKENNCELLIVTGCLAQRYKDDISSSMPEVDIILGTNDYEKIADVISDYYSKSEKNSCVSSENTPVSYNLPRIQSTPFYTAYLKIADGCDNFCTYCIIPKLRGKFRSRPMDSILSEARRLADNGVKELILVAQDTACYGKDTENDNLAILLRKLSQIENIKWIRLQYCYPENITDEIVNEIATNKKVVKYLDMPLQHVSDNVLKKMGRKSRKAEIEKLILNLRSRIPEISIRTSLITGFPGETDKDFADLKDFLNKYRIDKVGVFAYSREENTAAYNFDNQIDEDIKKKRRDIIMKQQQQISLEQNIKKIGNKTEVIIEGYDEDNFCYVGRCSTDSCDVDGNAYIYSDRELLVGDIVTAEIVDCSEYDVTVKVF